MASKRPKPPTFADLGERKRLRAAVSSGSSTTATTTPRSSLNAATLSDELFLLVFSFLDFNSLSAVERVDRHFMRLANDAILWKSLYLGLDLHPAPLADLAAPGSLATTSSTGRRIARLPLRAQQASASDDEVIDWKYLYRVRTNFSNGRSVLTSLPSTPTAARIEPSTKADQSSLPALLPSTAAPADAPASRRTTLVALASPYLLVFSAPEADKLPNGRVFLAKQSRSQEALRAGDELLAFVSPGLERERERGRHKGPVRAMDISLDAVGWMTAADGTRQARVYVAWSSGAFSLFVVSASTSSASAARTVQVDERHFQSSPPVPPPHPTVISALHGSLLVTCSDHFRLSFYHLPSSPPAGKQIWPFRSLRSLTSWHPATLLLSPSPTASHPRALKLSIAYSVPCYPDLFSAALQEITLAPSTSSSAAWDWLADRSLSALAPSGLGPFWDPASAGNTTPEQDVGTVGEVSAIAQDGRWVCLAGADNVVQVFEVPPPSESDAAGTGRLEWRQTLWAHSAGVTAVSVLDGRCITADSTGRLLISDLSDLARVAPCPVESQPVSVLPSPPATPRPASAKPVEWVEVLTPRRSSPAPSTPTATTHPGHQPSENSLWDDSHSMSTGRGTERIEWVCQDGERIVSVGVPREGPGGGDRTAASEGRVKVWAFDG